MARVRTALLMLALIVAGMVGLGAVHAAAPACDVPARLPAPRIEAPSDREPKRVLPIGGYTLSLIWLPQQCRTHGDGFACANKREAGFVLHGLWPDGQGKDWPQWCKPAAILPPATLRGHYCATPNPQLIQHEWAKHGTCMAGYTPERYFTLSNRLFGDFVQPQLRPLSYRHQTAQDVQRAVAAANRGLKWDMMRLNLDREGWLQEVWLCLDVRFRPQRCPAHQGGAQPEDDVKIWRGGNDRGDRSSDDRQGYRRRGRSS